MRPDRVKLQGMSSQAVNSFWADKFGHRFEALPDNVDALTAELADLEQSYNAYHTSLKNRIDALCSDQVSARTINALSLPAEIFLHICTFLAQIDPLGELCECSDSISVVEDDEDDSTRSVDSTDGVDDESYVDSEIGDICLEYGLGWSRVTHVCARWRGWAIDSADLWVTIPLDLCTPWIQELISRSKDLPLIATISCGAEEEIVLQFLHDHIHRLRSITADGCSSAIETILSDHCAPLLEEVELNAEHGSPLFCLPADFTRNFPSLRLISAYSVVLIPDFPQGTILSQITHLAILNATITSSHDTILGLIRALTCVEYLQLEDCFAPLSEEIGEQILEVTSLPRLETFILRGPTRACGALIQSVALPPLARVTLYLLPDLTDSTEVDSDDGAGNDYMQYSGILRLYDTLDVSQYYALRMQCIGFDGASRWQLVVTAYRYENRGDFGGCDPDSMRRESDWHGDSRADLKIVCLLPSTTGVNQDIDIALDVYKRTLTVMLLPSLAELSLDVDILVFTHQGSLDWDHKSWLTYLSGANGVKHLQLISSKRERTRSYIAWKDTRPNSYIALLLALSLRDNSVPGRVARLMPDLEVLSLVDVYAELTMKLGGRFQLTALEALRLLIASRGWQEGAVCAVYTGTIWQRRYFETYRDPLEPLDASLVQTAYIQDSIDKIYGFGPE